MKIENVKLNEQKLVFVLETSEQLRCTTAKHGATCQSGNHYRVEYLPGLYIIIRITNDVNFKTIEDKLRFYDDTILEIKSFLKNIVGLNNFNTLFDKYIIKLIS